MDPEIFSAADKIFLSFWTIFCPLISLTTWKIKILKKMRKTPGDIIILQNCIKNHTLLVAGKGTVKRCFKMELTAYFCRWYVTSLLLQVNRSWTHFTQGNKTEEKNASHRSKEHGQSVSQSVLIVKLEQAQSLLKT